MLQKQGAGGSDHNQQGAVSIGEAWDSLYLDLSVLEAENNSDNTSMAAM